jgi:hypothetical protein
MEEPRCAYLINTTPKYFYLLPLHISLLHKYAEYTQVYIATEAPELLPWEEFSKYGLSGIQVIKLSLDKEAFFDSRAEAVRLLPESIKYVFPIQEDFLLEGRPMEHVINQAFALLDENLNLSSVRLMPCPGPKGVNKFNAPLFPRTEVAGPPLNHMNRWLVLDNKSDPIIFTYQATIWRRGDYLAFMKALVAYCDSRNSSKSNRSKSQNNLAIKINLAEIEAGQLLLLKTLPNKIHIAWPRDGDHPNAVYLCPWPYRPTAVVRGVLEPWAIELAKREEVSLLESKSE